MNVKTNRSLHATLLLVILLITTPISRASPLSPASGDHPKAYWLRQIAKVHPAMQQYIVEKFLPSRSEGSMDFAKDGGSYTFTYALDENWSVATDYDRSGFHPENNPYMTMGFPNDKVIRPPRLFRHRNRIDTRLYPAYTPK
jgi:hypothetical protein